MALSLRTLGLVSGVLIGAAVCPNLAHGQTGSDRSSDEDERVQVDQNFPVSVESAGVSDRGEVEVRLLAGYGRLRSARGSSAGSFDSDDAIRQRSGRDLVDSGVEAEIGLGHGLSTSLGLTYAFGNAEGSKTGAVDFALKWNFLQAEGLRPALTVIGGVSAPFGPRHESSETVLGLLASQPLSTGANSLLLHANIVWFHSLDRGEGERTDRYATSVALGVPVTLSTGLFIGYSREQEAERRQVGQFIELGVRQILPAGFVLGAGLGVGVGDSSSDFRLLAGVQKSF